MIVTLGLEGFIKVSQAWCDKAKARVRKFADAKQCEPWEPGHVLHAGIVDWAAKFTFNQYGVPLWTDTPPYVDPFHIWLGLFSKQDWTLVMHIFDSHSLLHELQLWAMSEDVKLPHLSVTCDDDYAACWGEHVNMLNVTHAKDKPVSRGDPTGRECVTLQQQLKGAAKLLLIQPSAQKSQCFHLLNRIADTGNLALDPIDMNTHFDCDRCNGSKVAEADNIMRSRSSAGI